MTTPDDKAKVYAYGRVSTHKQQISVEVQKQQAEAYIKWKLEPLGVEYKDGWFCDPAVSGKVPLKDRQAGGTMFDRLKRGDHVVVTKYDRCFRSLVDAVNTIDEWSKKGVIIHFLDIGMDTSGPLGKMVLVVFGMFAEFERERIALRTKEAKHRLKEEGRSYGMTPMGFKVVKRGGKKYLDHELKDQLVMRRVWELQQNGEILRDIALKLTLNGISLGGITRWTAPRVWTVAKRYGKLLAAGKLHPDAITTSSESPPTDASTT